MCYYFLPYFLSILKFDPLDKLIEDGSYRPLLGYSIILEWRYNEILAIDLC